MKRLAFKPLAFIGLGVLLLGIFAPDLFQNRSDYMLVLRAILIMVGLYLGLKGRKEY